VLLFSQKSLFAPYGSKKHLTYVGRIGKITRIWIHQRKNCRKNNLSKKWVSPTLIQLVWKSICQSFPINDWCRLCCSTETSPRKWPIIVSVVIFSFVDIIDNSFAIQLVVASWCLGRSIRLALWVNIHNGSQPASSNVMWLCGRGELINRRKEGKVYSIINISK
jgi:hypothetical protein